MALGIGFVFYGSKKVILYRLLRRIACGENRIKAAQQSCLPYYVIVG